MLKQSSAWLCWKKFIRPIRPSVNLGGLKLLPHYFKARTLKQIAYAEIEAAQKEVVDVLKFTRRKQFVSKGHAQVFVHLENETKCNLVGEGHALPVLGEQDIRGNGGT